MVDLDRGVERLATPEEIAEGIVAQTLDEYNQKESSMTNYDRNQKTNRSTPRRTEGSTRREPSRAQGNERQGRPRGG